MAFEPLRCPQCGSPMVALPPGWTDYCSTDCRDGAEVRRCMNPNPWMGLDSNTWLLKYREMTAEDEQRILYGVKPGNDGKT